MEYYGQNGRRYNLKASPFKKGGEGSVYELVGNDQLVAKIYHAKVVTEELKSKIKYITNNPPDKSILNQIAWPQDYLMDSAGNFVGFVMPKLQIDAELGELYVYPPKKIQLTNDQKLVVAINICRVISEIHKAGYVFGDFNPCNIGVNLTTGNVAFLDTDSYHIYDKTTGYTYRCVVCYNGYVAPELIQKCKGRDYKTVSLPTFTQETDRFALAIHIFKLLFNGFTPYNGILETERSSQASPGFGNAAIEQDNYCFKPGNKPLSMAVPPLSSFPQAIQDLFTRAFIDGRNNPTKRPKAEEWDRALCDYRNQLVGCSNNSLHAYYNRLPACPYCEADARYNVMLSIGSVYGGTSSSQISFSQPVAIPSTSQSRTRSANSGSSTTSSAINRGKRNQAKTGFRKKFRIALIIILCVLFAGAGTGGGIYYKISLDKINETTQLISYLPDYAIEDYSELDEMILEAYNSYNSLADWQKEKVENRDRLLTLVPKYNEYKVALLRETANKVTVDTVAETDDLAICIKLYSELTNEQKAMLHGDEITKFENFIKVNDVIIKLSSLNDDALSNPDEYLSSVRRTYFSIAEEYKPLVYNYSEIDSFADRIAFMSQFSLEQTEGGYSIAVKEGVQLSGVVELPTTYNNKDIISIKEDGFADNINLTSIAVPNTVTEIGVAAFKGCDGLESISLPFTGKSADAEAYEAVFGYIFGYTTKSYGVGYGTSNSSSTKFYNTQYSSVSGATWQYACLNYQSGSTYGNTSYFYYIPSSLKTVMITNQTEVKDAAFNGCKNITSIKYAGAFTALGVAGFQDCGALTKLNSDQEKTLDASGSYKTLNEFAFRNCFAVEKVIMPQSITKIGKNAFENISQITSIAVPNTVTEIGVAAFKGCDGLESISLPFTGKSADAEAYEAVFGYIFGYTTKSYGVGYGTSNSSSTKFYNTQYGSVSGATWQYACLNYQSGSTYGNTSYFYYIPSSLKTVTITNQTEVKDAAFNGCKMLTSITYTKGISKRGDCAFQNCTAEIHP